MREPLTETRALALTRIGWAAAALFESLVSFGRLGAYGGDVYAVPLVPGVRGLSPGAAGALLGVASGAALAAAIGLRARLAIALCASAHAYLFAVSVLNFKNHVYLLCLLGLALALSPCDEALAVKPASRPRQASPWPNVLRAQLLIVYFFAAAQKLNAPFLSGWAARELLSAAAAAGPFGEALGGWIAARTDGQAQALAWAAVAVEALLFVGLAWPSTKARRIAIVTGALFHATLAATLGVFTFSLLMVSVYPLFWIPPRRR